jgi:murein DD-endopeptidase MepM/ murein hydrolase activator NlpD
MKVPFAGCVLKEYPAGHISQYFGENPSLYAKMGLKGHNGIDLVSEHGTHMVAVEDGTVLEVKNDPNGYGKHIRFISKRSQNGLSREWTYGHCDEIMVAVGDKVLEGESIATMGNTGFVVSDNNGNGFWSFNPFKGTHLHLGMRLVEKNIHGWSYPNSKIKIRVPNYENGYKGAVDPLTAFDITVTPNIANLEAQVSILTKILELLKLKKALV